MPAELAAAAVPPRVVSLDIEQIRQDPELQLRAGGKLDPVYVARYAEILIDGGELDPVVVYQDTAGVCWLADGWHRLAAAVDAFRDEIRAEVRLGSRRDALLWAAGCNARHGKPVTNADKRRAVGALLDLAEREGDESPLDTPAIATATGTTPQFVNKIKRERRDAALEAELRARVPYPTTPPAETVSVPPPPPPPPPPPEQVGEADPWAAERRAALQALHRLHAEGIARIAGSEMLVDWQLAAVEGMSGLELVALRDALGVAEQLEREQRRGLELDLQVLADVGAVVSVGGELRRARPDLAWSTRLRHLRELARSADEARRQAGTLPPTLPPAELVLENPTPYVGRPEPIPEPEPAPAPEPLPEPDPRQVPIPLDVTVPEPVGGVIELPITASRAQLEAAILRVQRRSKVGLADAAEVAGRVREALNRVATMARTLGEGCDYLWPDGDFWTFNAGCYGDHTLVSVRTNQIPIRQTAIRVLRGYPGTCGRENGRLDLHLRAGRGTP